MCKALERRLRTKAFGRNGEPFRNIWITRSITTREGKDMNLTYEDVHESLDDGLQEENDSRATESVGGGGEDKGRGSQDGNHVGVQDEKDTPATGSGGREEEGKEIGSGTEGAAQSKDLSEDDSVDKVFRKKLRKAVADVTVGNPKLRRRFYTFLKCITMKKIARSAGVTKQNVWKQFAALMEEIARKTGIGWKPTSPFDFKDRVKNPR